MGSKWSIIHFHYSLNQNIRPNFFLSFFLLLRNLRQILLKSGNRHGTTLSTMVAWMWCGGNASPALSAKILLCKVSHIFSFLAVALVMWFILIIFAAGGALLPTVATLLVWSRCSGLERGKTENKIVFITQFSFYNQLNIVAGNKN